MSDREPTTPPYPAWVREITTLLPACAHFVLSGNVRDQYFGPGRGPDDGSVLRQLPAMLGQALIDRGLRLVLGYEINEGVGVVASAGITADEITSIVGAAPEQLATPGRLADLGSLVTAVAQASEPVALLVHSASRLVRSRANLTDDEFTFFRSIDRTARTSRPRPTAGGARLHSPVIWITDQERDLPAWFTVNNAALRNVAVPLPPAGERERMARNLLPLLAPDVPPSALSRPVRTLTEQTAGAPLVALRNTVQIATDLRLAPDRIEDAARSYRAGILENPWRSDFVVRRLREETSDPSEALPDGRRRLNERVLGQDAAVEKVFDILARSAAGLTAAQAGSSATRPRGVLFFAGPTGVGKTELAKAVTTLLFGDENAYVRFDMSEFSAEHSADRLIGAPPGYVGHDNGGELTNAVRQRPFSVVLFDEIEKAHERILDKFLQLLDDGRLTDGRGETIYFSEALIVFTSNLGIYEDAREVVDGREVSRRRQAVSPATHPTPEARALVIKQSIRDHFTLRLGRPELLNRIGDDNIVVFDFIGAATAQRILDAMLANVAERLRHEHGFELALSEWTRTVVTEACLGDDVLAMGGRGIGAKLETTLVNPLARLITLEPRPAGAPTVDVRQDGHRWVASWT